MYRLILIALSFNFLTFIVPSYATMQKPDILKYNGKKLELNTSWAFPSPLQIYYEKERIPYPFEWISTANYRGHIAHWEIKNKKLFLKEIHVEDEKHTPEYYGVLKSNNERKNKVEAYWFTGVIECRLKSKKDKYEITRTYIFYIKNGKLIEQTSFKKWLGDLENPNEIRLLKMHSDFMSFYYNQYNQEYEKIKHEGNEAILPLKWIKYSPIFDYYGEGFDNFKYNWENEEKNGYPYCSWEIISDSIYLTNYKINYGNRIDTFFTHTIELGSEFNSLQSENVHANWINSVFILLEGQFSIQTKKFEISNQLIIKLEEGIVTEKYKIDKNNSFDELKNHSDTRIRSLFLLYEKIHH